MDKVFIGKTEVKQTSFGNLEVISLGPKDFDLLQQHKNEKGWIKLVRKTTKDGKPYFEVDTWKPDPNYKSNQTNPRKGVHPTRETSNSGAQTDLGEDLPF